MNFTGSCLSFSLPLFTFLALFFFFYDDVGNSFSLKFLDLFTLTIAISL